MFLGYNTNGFAHHRLPDALSILRELGYTGIALTPDVNHFDPFREDWQELAESLEGFRVVIETGARFLLNPREKHQPTLLTLDPDERSRRSAFLRQCIDLAVLLKAEAVSFWSGTSLTTDSPMSLMTRLVAECRSLADYAGDHGVRLAFEPEPGMLIDTMAKFAELHAEVDHPAFGLTLDIGHLVCQHEVPVSEVIAKWKPWLWNVHIEDMRAGVHDHLLFGEGHVDFDDVFQGLRSANYQGGVYVELSRHSHDAVRTAKKSREFLSKWLGASGLIS
jgi:L-ribulose-5-phosphate 3-epimerase